MRILYAVPDLDRPSWGLAILYYHVKMLVQNGFDAAIVKQPPLASPAWIDVPVPVEDVKTAFYVLTPQDFLIVPEVMVNYKRLKSVVCKKIIFIQAAGFLFESMPKDEDHLSLGFMHAFTILPHMAEIVEKHVCIPHTLIPPFVSELFFEGPSKKIKRKRRILLYPKFQVIDYNIVKYLLFRFIKSRNSNWVKNMINCENWEIVELKNMAHNEIAKQMKEAAFFVSLNNFEALNTSVVEAMAAGCVVFCYEGFGPRDYLENNKNAVVFPNNEAYELVESLCSWIENYENREEEYKQIQQNGKVTAQQFTYKKTEEGVVRFFKEQSR